MPGNLEDSSVEESGRSLAPVCGPEIGFQWVGAREGDVVNRRLPIVFIYRRGDEAELGRVVREDGSDELIIFEVNKWLDLEQCPAGTRFTTYESYLSEEELVEIDRRALRLTQQWYRQAQDVTTFDGLSMGSLYEADLMGFFSRMLKDIEAVRKVITRERPARIVVVEDRNREIVLARVVEVLGRHMGVDVNVVKGPTGAVQAEPWAESSTRKALEVAGKCVGWLWKAYWRFRRALRARGSPGEAVLLWPYFRFQSHLDHLRRFPVRIVIPGSFNFRKDCYWARNVRHVVLEDYLPAGERRDLRDDLYIHYQKIWGQLRQDQGFRSEFAFDGIPFWDLVESKLATMFARDFVEGAELCRTMRKLLEAEAVRAVVVYGDEMGPMKAAVMTANSLGLATVTIDHGIGSSIPYWLGANSQHVVTWGRAGMEGWLRFGVDRAKIITIGEPSFDNLTERALRTSRRRVLCKLGFDPAKKTVLFASQPYGTFCAIFSQLDPERDIMAMFKAAGELPEYQFVLKFHYSYDGEFQTELARRLGQRNVRLLPHKEMSRLGIDIHGLIIACDVCITSSSTVGVEALLLDRPLIVLNVTGKRDLASYASRGPAVGVYSAEHLAPAIRAILEGGKGDPLAEARRREYLAEEVVNFTRGDAGAKVAELIWGAVQSVRNGADLPGG